MLIVPLIIEKIYRHQVLAKFNSNSFWRTLYRIGFMRRYLHRVAGGKLMKLFGGRLRFLGIGGAKLDGGAEKFLLEALRPLCHRLRADRDRTAAGRRGPFDGAAGIDRSPRPRASNCGWRTSTRDPSGRDRGPHAERDGGLFQESRGHEGGFHGRRMVPHGRPRGAGQGRLALHQGPSEEHDRGSGGENIYPEDIETVLNSHVCIADSIVTEQEGRLIALVHFNREEIESMIDDWREEWESKKEAWEAKTEQLKKEIMDFVNAKVNRFSRISEVVEEKEDFIKTPTHKIKRFLYNKNKNGQTPDQPAAGK